MLAALLPSLLLPSLLLPSLLLPSLLLPSLLLPSLPPGTIAAAAANATWLNASADSDIHSYSEKIHLCLEGKEVKLDCEDFWLVVAGIRAEDTLLCLNYDQDESPAVAYKIANGNKEHTVLAAVDFDKLVQFDTHAQTWSIDFALALRWPEPRLAFPPGCITSNSSSFSVDAPSELRPRLWTKLWTPPVQMRSLFDIREDKSFQPARTFAMSQDGLIRSTGRYTSKMGCRMDFTSFPFDEQTCEFDLYLTQGSSKLDWLPSAMSSSSGEDLHLPEWSVDFKVGEDFNITNKYTGEVNSGLSVFLRFRREFTVHLMHTFFPSVMIASTSVSSVLVPPHLVPGRMGLCVTSFLSMISLFNGSRASWPTTAYLKAADVWTTGCYVTVFASLAEYCLFLFLMEGGGGGKGSNKTGAGDDKGQPKKEDQPRSVRHAFALRMESAARVALPGFFLLFNFVFWIAVLA